MDIPLELQLDIFDNLDVYSLTNIAIASPSHRHAAEKVFNATFATDFIINLQKINAKDFKIVSNNTSEFDAIQNTIKSFGHLIRNLSINYNSFTAFESDQINHCISKYVTISLTNIDLNGCHNRKLGGLMGPFEKVNVVRLRNGEMTSKFINFNKIFPAVQSFDLTEMWFVSAESMSHHFVHLHALQVENILDGVSDKLVQIFRLNPQLTTVSIYNVNWNGLKRLSELLPKLECLKLFRFYGKSHFDGGNIHFKHIKSLSMKFIQYLPDDMHTPPLVFDALEEIYFDGPTNKWFEIIMHNKCLTKIVAEHELNHEQLIQIAKHLTHLKELSMRYNANTFDGVWTVVRLIEQSKTLRKMTFLRMNKSNFDISTISHGQHDWRIASMDEHVIFARN